MYNFRWYQIAMNEVLRKFLKVQINAQQLREKCGNDLYNVTIEKPETVYAKDLVFLIEQYLSSGLTLQDVVDWVNIIWFTDLYEYNPKEEESIASVLLLLETLDEEDVEFTKEEFLGMIECLNCNKVYEN